MSTACLPPLHRADREGRAGINRQCVKPAGHPNRASAESVKFPHSLYKCFSLAERGVLAQGASDPRRALFKTTLTPAFLSATISYHTISSYQTIAD